MIMDQIDSQLAASRPATQTRNRLAGFLWKVVRIPLYLAVVFGTVSVLLLAVERTAEHGLKRGRLGDIYQRHFSLVKRDYTRPVPHYDYDFVPGVCLIDDTLKGNRYEYANNAGFREPTDISPEKPDDEFRIFLTGGSTAFGLGSTGDAYNAVGPYTIEYRETISHMLEMILNSTSPIPGKRIRVYNAAVWGYSYQNNFMRYLAKLRHYQPDLLISIDGANEIAAASKLSRDWNYFKEGQYNNILRQMFDYDVTGLSSYVTLWLKNNTYLMNYLWHGRDSFQDLGARLWRDAEEARRERGTGVPDFSPQEASRLAEENVETVVRVVENYHSILENDKVPHIFVLQPWFYLSKKPLHEKEKILAEVQQYKYYYGVPSERMYGLLVYRITESAGRKRYFVADFSHYFDDVSEWVFTDWCHLTSGANYLIARELASLVKQHVFAQPLTQGDIVDQKNSYFWDLAYTAKVVYAPDPDSPKSGPRNMLRGYPGEELYSSKTVAEKDRLEVVLDFQRSYPVSRLRIVWGDGPSVPDKWIVELSEDGEDWQTFVKADKPQTDDFSLWPGFEHYRSEPLKGRYLRYKFRDRDLRHMRLRCLSVQR